MSLLSDFLPSIDGHFWIKKSDGTIIDPWFDQYNFVINLFQTTNERLYLPAPDFVQILMRTRFERGVDKFLKTHNWNMDRLLTTYKLQFGNCYMNCLIGEPGELVFGSLGFKREDGSIHYEYGGADWNNYIQFLNQRPHGTQEDNLLELLKRWVSFAT